MSPVSIHGNDSFTVAERLKLANEGHEPPTKITIIHTQAEQIGNLTVVHATVIFEDGRKFSGTEPGKPASHVPGGTGCPPGDRRDIGRRAGTGLRRILR